MSLAMGLLVSIAAAGTACEVRLAFTATSTVDTVDLAPGDGICDAGPGSGCTLRAAVQEGNVSTAPVTIVLAAGQTYELSLAETPVDSDAGGDLDIDHDIEIDGQGATITSIPAYSLMEVRSGALALHDARILLNTAFPSSVEVYGIVNHSSLVVDRIVVDGMFLCFFPFCTRQQVITQHGGNVVVRDSTFRPGWTVNAVVSIRAGTAILQGSTFSHTVSDGLVNQSGGTVLIVDSTFSESEVTATSPVPRPGGWMTLTDSAVAVVQTDGSMLIRRSTFVHNKSAIRKDAPGGTIDVAGSVFDSISDDCPGSAIASSGYNADSDGTCFTGANPTDQPSAAVSVGVLADNGGSTQTQLPPIGSLLVDAIPPGVADLCPSAKPTDQRGQPRPAGAGCDIGAVERVPSDP